MGRIPEKPTKTIGWLLTTGTQGESGHPVMINLRIRSGDDMHGTLGFGSSEDHGVCPDASYDVLSEPKTLPTRIPRPDHESDLKSYSLLST